MNSIFSLRLKKAWFSVSHPRCWNALRLGVFPAIEHRPVLAGLDCDAIVDAGANRGQFSLISRLVKPDLLIIAFEPIPTEAAIFRKALFDENIQLHQVALGEKVGEAEIHLSRSADSSSLLPIGETQKKLFRDTDEVGRLNIPVKRLDDFQGEWKGHARLLLKIDVQGFELSVLKGAMETLKSCAYLYIECSETELYVGQALYGEVAEFLSQHGFKRQSRSNETVLHGNLIQADYLFVRI